MAWGCARVISPASHPGRNQERENMVRTRASSFGLIALIALGFGVAACKKKEENKAGTPGDKTAQKAGDNPVTKPALMVGGDDLALLPSDAEVVLGLNFEQLQKSALWKQYSPKLMEKAASGLADFKAMCGFDPLEKFKKIGRASCRERV